MSPARHTGHFPPTWWAACLWIAAALSLPLRADEGLRLRAPPSDRSGFLAREWIRETGKKLTAARDWMGARKSAAAPGGAEVQALGILLGQTPSLVAAFSPERVALWGLGSESPALPGDLEADRFRVEWRSESAPNEARVWLPPRGNTSLAGWSCLDIDLSILLSSTAPSNQLVGTESLVVWRPDPLGVLAEACAAPGLPWLPAAARQKRKDNVRALFEDMERQERGVRVINRFASDESRLLRSRVEWFPLALSGLRLQATLDIELPFVAHRNDTSGTWRRMEPEAKEAFDFLEEEGGWVLRGREAWAGARLEGRSLDGVYSASRFDVRAGLPGLNSFSARLQPDGILVADVYQIREKAMHHFVYRFHRLGPFVSDPDDELPLKTQVR